jgi:hypothetical protein
VPTFDSLRNRMRAAAALEDWPAYVALGEQEVSLVTSQGPAQGYNLERSAKPVLAIGYAHVGRLAEAEALAA